jgi:type III pantothenate kinase
VIWFKLIWISQTPAIVIDFGTATTFDVITEGGIYSGGLIAPGINLSVEALSAAAAKLPRVAIHTPKSVIGKNTVDAIQSGIYHGYLGLIEGIVERVTAEMKAKPFVLATGGLAQLFAPSTNAIDTIDQNLTLKGLYELAKRLEL